MTYTEGQELWSRTTGLKCTVDVHAGNRVMMTDDEGYTTTWRLRDVNTYFTTEPQEKVQFVEPEDEPCDVEWD